jgi:hypothetical protein
MAASVNNNDSSDGEADEDGNDEAEDSDGLQTVMDVGSPERTRPESRSNPKRSFDQLNSQPGDRATSSKAANPRKRPKVDSKGGDPLLRATGQLNSQPGDRATSSKEANPRKRPKVDSKGGDPLLNTVTPIDVDSYCSIWEPNTGKEFVSGLGSFTTQCMTNFRLRPKNFHYRRIEILPRFRVTKNSGLSTQKGTYTPFDLDSM